MQRLVNEAKPKLLPSTMGNDILLDGNVVAYYKRHERQMLQEVVIVCVGTNKEPENSITFSGTYRSIVRSDASRPNVFLFVNTLEVKARMKWVPFKFLIISPCLVLYITR
jgi:hypothetical protein